MNNLLNKVGLKNDSIGYNKMRQNLVKELKKVRTDLKRRINNQSN